MGDSWIHVFDTIRTWPWSTIAAFMAVAVTLGLARSESGQKRRQLQQDAILDINYQSTAWINAAGEFLAYVRTWLESAGTTKLPWSMEVLEPITAATNDMDRALKSVHMACNDYQIISRATEAETQLSEFLTLLNGPHPDAKTELREELTNVMASGRELQLAFSKTTEQMVRRGFNAYALPKGPKFRIRHAVAVASRWIKVQLSGGTGAVGRGKEKIQ